MHARLFLGLCVPLALMAACGGGGTGPAVNPGGGGGGGAGGGGGVGPGLPTLFGEFRLNQVGYLPGDPKVALLLSTTDLRGQSFQVRDVATGAVVFEGPVGADRGAYASFAHLHELQFTTVGRTGAFALTAGGRRSLAFPIGGDAYAPVIARTLQMLEVQRCGDTQPRMHGACHRTDGTARGGPQDGVRIDATGGWHDAGDYLKFVITVGTACDFLLTAFQRHPERFADADRDLVPDVLAEARVGLDWMLRMWDPAHDVLYHQVGDASDHGAFRMPEVDDTTRPYRPVFACEPGKGANVAGKAAAAWALAATLFGDAAQPYYAPALANTYRTAAMQVYEYGKARPAAQASTDGFYPENSWQDDLALAAAELYRATGVGQYLSDARGYARAAGNAYLLRYEDLSALAHYEIARLDPTYVGEAADRLAIDLDNALRFSQREPFQNGLEFFQWGSGMVTLGFALEALYYEDLTGDPRYRELCQAQRDFLLGRNAWGVCFTAGSGSVWPHHPHHQIASLLNTDLIGAWVEGPVIASMFLGQIGQLSGPDLFAAFQTPAGVYHDDVVDYTTNEAGIEPAGMGIAMASWFVR